MKNFEMINFDECKNLTAIKALSREVGNKLLYDALVNILGEENVSMVITNEKGTVEVAAVLGTKTNSEGTPMEVCVTFKTTAKEYEDRKTSTGKIVDSFDRFESAAEYKRKLENDRLKAEKKAKEKEEKKKK